MNNKGELVVSVGVDTTELEKQAADLKSLLESALENAPDDFISAVYRNLPTVLNDVVFANASPATSAGLNIIHRVRFGTKYERFTSAIRTGELNSDLL